MTANNEPESCFVVVPFDLMQKCVGWTGIASRWNLSEDTLAKLEVLHHDLHRELLKATGNTHMNAEDKLHSAICNAVILLNNGEEIAPRVSSILRTALAEYEPTPEATTAAGLVDGVPLIRFDGDAVEAVVQHLLTAGYTCDGDYEDFFMGVKNGMEAAIGREALTPPPIDNGTPTVAGDNL